MNFLNYSELPILDFIQEYLSCGFLNKVMPVITSLADAGIIWIIAAVVMLCFKKTRKMGLTVGLALVIGLTLGNGVMKPLINRVRPYTLNENIKLLIDPLHDGSFPSGHTLASFEAAGAMMLRNKRFGIPALVLAIVIAFSRLYLYVHYPTDILGGIAFGLLFAFVSYILINKLYAKFGWDADISRKNLLD